jgi:mannose-6-phosphate isomerase-like protein (cupin superfamily)
MRAVVRLPGEGEQIGAPSSVTIKAMGKDTAGSFYLGEAMIAPGFTGPPPHVHERLHDMFYVLDGMLTMQVGDATVDLAAGSFVCVPPGTVHTFSNRSEQPVRFLNFSTPAGWENYMRDLAATLASGSPTAEEIGRIRLSLRLPSSLTAERPLAPACPVLTTTRSKACLIFRPSAAGQRNPEPTFKRRDVLCRDSAVCSLGNSDVRQKQLTGGGREQAGLRER